MRLKLLFALHDFYAGDDQFFDKCRLYFILLWEASGPYRQNATFKLLFVVSNYRWTDMQPYIRLFVAEPSEHATVVVALVYIAVTRELKVAYCFYSIWCNLADCGPDFLQFVLDLFWAFCNIFIDPTRNNGLLAHRLVLQNK